MPHFKPPVKYRGYDLLHDFHRRKTIWYVTRNERFLDPFPWQRQLRGAPEQSMLGHSLAEAKQMVDYLVDGPAAGVVGAFHALKKRRYTKRRRY
jgi:hypothetical protein